MLILESINNEGGMTVRKENEPTDNQINYARSLDIYIPFGITFNELSDLISNVENNDKLATERHKAFADFYGIQYTKNVGKKSLFNKIQSEIFLNAQKDHMASWFIFRVYRSLVRGQEDVSILSPDNDTIREITGTLLENPKFFNSLKRYSDSDLRYFGEFTDHQGFTRFKPIMIRQNKYLNNRIEQDHRFIKKRVRAMLGFKSFRSAQIILSGIELMHMMRKGQFDFLGSKDSVGSLYQLVS